MGLMGGSRGLWRGVWRMGGVVHELWKNFGSISNRSCVGGIQYGIFESMDVDVCDRDVPSCV